MQNQRTGQGSISQEADEEYVGRELNRHAARANDAHDRYDALERRLEQLVVKWRMGVAEDVRNAALQACADELERVLDVESSEDAP